MFTLFFYNDKAYNKVRLSQSCTNKSEESGIHYTNGDEL